MISKLARKMIFAGQQVCQEHGTFNAIHAPGQPARCPHCVLEGVRAEDAEEAANKLRSRGLQRYWCSGVLRDTPPARFANVDFSNYHTDDNEDKARAKITVGRYVENFKAGQSRSMILCGVPGTGKTHLAIAAARRLAERGFRVIYMTVFDLVNQAQRNTRENGSIYEYLNTYDIVFVDEIGAHGDFGFNQELVLSTMFQLIDGRYANSLPTMLITNLSIHELLLAENGLGSRVMDRLRDADQVGFDWDSYRDLTTK